MESSSYSRAGPSRPCTSSTDGAGSKIVVRDVGLIEHNYEGPPRYCKCGFKAPRWTSWRPWSIGRRFYGCPNFLDDELKCSYFIWHDLQLTQDKVVELLKLLINEKKALTVEITPLRRQLRDKMSGGAFVESNHAISRTDVDSIQNLDEIVEKTVANAVNDVVERKLDALIASSVGSELKKLRVHIVFGVFILMVMLLLFRCLF